MLPKKPNIEVVKLSSMTKEELMNYILDSFKQYYDDCEFAERAEYSLSRNFYQGVGRGFWECQRIVNEIKGRLTAEQRSEKEYPAQHISQDIFSEKPKMKKQTWSGGGFGI